MAISRQHLASLLLAVMFSSVTAQLFLPIYELKPEPTNVQLDNASFPIVILSPNYGRGNYPNNVNYTLTIRSRGDPLVLVFFFRHFQTEYQRECAHDALSLQGIKYCGLWETGRRIPWYLPEAGSIAVNFKTDPSVTKSGFELIVIAE